MLLGHPLSAVPRLPLILVINAAIFMVYGRVRKSWPVAILGFAVLALAALLLVFGVTG